MDIEDLLGNRQASLFQKDLRGVLQQKQFPEISSARSSKIFVNCEFVPDE